MEKIANENIYVDMIAENDVCKIVSQGDGEFKLYIFDRNGYIPVNVDMSFLDSVIILSSLYHITEILKRREIKFVMYRDVKVKTTLHKANGVFRKGYSEAIIKYKDNENILNQVSAVRERCDALRLAADEETCKRCNEILINDLKKSIENKTFIPVDIDELKAIEEKYRVRIEAEGILPSELERIFKNREHIFKNGVQI